MGDLGVLTATGDDWKLTFTRRFNHPADKVWRAVTEEEHLVKWFPQKIKGEWKAGAPLRFEMDGGDGFDGEVVQFDPPSVVEIMWGTDRLRIEVRPDGEGSVLVLTDTFAELGKAAPRRARAGTSASAGSRPTSMARPSRSGEPTGSSCSSATRRSSVPKPRRSGRPRVGSPRGRDRVRARARSPFVPPGRAPSRPRSRTGPSRSPGTPILRWAHRVTQHSRSHSRWRRARR